LNIRWPHLSVEQRTPSNSGYFSNPAGNIFFALPWYSTRNADGSFNYGSANDYGGGNGNFPLIAGDNYNPLIIAAYRRIGPIPYTEMKANSNLADEQNPSY